MLREYVSHRIAEAVEFTGSACIGLQAGRAVSFLPDTTGMVFGGADGCGAGGTAAQLEILLRCFTHSGPSPLSPTLPQFS